MFKSGVSKRKFTYTTVKNVKKEEGIPVGQRMKFSSFSSQERKQSKKKTIFLLILLLMVTAFIMYHGFKTSGTYDLKIDENEIERIDGE
ncbi:MAG: hypothetical protein JXN63_02615 [Candidatus Delongbacteria bacterium]|nr:hypothetical protein [Candidatus Delongbacteria bacterium]